jgi:hypothetical protein
LTRILVALARTVASPHHVAIMVGELVEIHDLNRNAVGFIEVRGDRGV